MKSHKLPVARHVGINVTPMIDLMMCLIIFFMLAAKLADEENDKDVVLPKIRQVRKMDSGDYLYGRLTINIVAADPAKGRNVRYTVRGAERSVGELATMMKEAVADDPKTRVTIRPAHDVPYNDIQGLMVRAGKAKVPNVYFAAAGVENEDD